MEICVNSGRSGPYIVFLGRLDGISRFKTRFTAIPTRSVRVTGRKAPSYGPERLTGRNGSSLRAVTFSA